MEDIAKLIDSISKLFNATIWPLLFVFVFVRYRESIGMFLDTLSEFSFNGLGIQTSFRRKQAEATAALVAATVARTDASTTPEMVAREAKAATEAVSAVTARAFRRAKKAKVLWVDDRPNNNIRERQALEALGVEFILSLSTEDALEKMSHQGFDMVISDMGRPPDPNAGYTLLDQMRASKNNTPLVFYAGSRSPEHVQESRRRGALGCTNRPDELFEYVFSEIGRD
jgi:CheY-like chemotaxis protein|nr:response regulator [Neorhizobium tomejilense]